MISDDQYEIVKGQNVCGHREIVNQMIREVLAALYNCMMHSFEVNIRIIQPEISDVHRGEAEVNITFAG